ncbi:MAG: hypothetical protein MUF25_14280, partial [Pirellulaceae bacterium]|nr:hypothetical protein [Pirellulaceae bacterium]
NDGANSVSFEFQLDQQNPPPQTDPNATLLEVGPGTTPLQIASDLADAINASGLNIIAHAPGRRVSMEGDFAVSVSPGAIGLRVRGTAGAAPILQGVDGSQIKDGDNFYLNSGGFFQKFEFDTGYTLVTPVRYMLEMPTVGGRGINDGERFTIGNTTTGVNLTFELDRDGRVSVPPAQVISYSSSDTADQLAAKIVAVIGNPILSLNLAPTAQAGGVVHLGSTRFNSLNTANAPSITSRGVAGGITEGERFRIGDGFRTVVFEMDSDGVLADAAHVPIAFSQAATHDQIGANIAAAVQAQPLALTPTYLGDGLVHLGGDDGIPAGSRNHVLDTSTAANISDTGRPGVSDATAVPVDFIIPGPSFTAAQVINRIDVAIQTASANKQIEQAFAGANLWDGRTFSVVNRGRTYTFEYDDTRFGPAGVALGNFRIAFDPGDPNANPVVPSTPAATMAQRIAAAVRAAIPNAVVTVGIRDRVVIQEYGIDLTTQPVNDRIVVNGDRILFTPGSSAIRDITSYGLGFTLITNVEESYDIYNPDPRLTPFLPADYTVQPAAPPPPGRNMTDHIIATRVAAVVGPVIDVDLNDGAWGAGGFLSRINFPDAVTADFAGMNMPGLPQVWRPVATSASGVSSGNVRVVVLADDWPENHNVDRDVNGTADGAPVLGLANRVSNAINQTLNPTSDPQGIAAAARGRYVRLNRGSIINNSSIITKGEGPGGKVTGIATLNGQVYAVSDQGGLYRINDPFNEAGNDDDVQTTYIATSREDLLGIDFSGLTAGPPNVENGAYNNMLFATDSAGTLYAFNTAGVAQPVFANGATSVSTGNHNNREVRGLAFSTLDHNLFERTPTTSELIPATAMDVRLGRATRVGQLITVDKQQFTAGHENYTTGTSSIHFGQGNVAGAPRSYDFPGGAHGSIVSNEFSLKGYSAADKPALYFSYYLDTENDSSAPLDRMMRDAVRVYISDNNGDWQELATNNSYRGGGFVDDELQDFDAAYRTATAADDANQYFDIQEMFDVDDWRQVRIPLDQYSGRTNLRLRVDFSTAGDLNIGNAATGEEIRAVAGIFIQDGQTAQIGPHVLEFDSGVTIVAPTGAAIPLNEEMTLTDDLDNTAVLRFVSNTLTSSDMVVTDGSQLFDGDVFYLDDGTGARAFEFDSGFILTVPPTGSGGINDQEILLIDLDGAGVNLPIAFEFDKNGILIDVDGVPGPDNGANIINVADNLTILVPLTGGQILDGDTMRLSNGVTSYTFEFDKDGTLINPFNLPINAAQNRILGLPAAGGGVGGVRDGDTFRIDPDGLGAIAPVVFEFDSNGVVSASDVIQFDHFTTQDVLADRVAAAILGRFGVLQLNAKNTGGGIVVLDGTTYRTVV